MSRHVKGHERLAQSIDLFDRLTIRLEQSRNAGSVHHAMIDAGRKPQGNPHVRLEVSWMIAGLTTENRPRTYLPTRSISFADAFKRQEINGGVDIVRRLK